jgi:transposase, IS5 family
MLTRTHRALDHNDAIDAVTVRIEKIKVSVGAKVERPFRVVRFRFGHFKATYSGLAKNAAQVTTSAEVSNLWTARHELHGAEG